MSDAPETEQPTGWVPPLEESDDLDAFLDDDGQIKGSPANDGDDQ